MICNIIVELGSVSALTMGGGHGAIEGARPSKMRLKSDESTMTIAQVAQAVELGKAAELTLGGSGYRFEQRMRPNCLYSN
jgi:hypothetical protein